MRGAPGQPPAPLLEVQDLRVSLNTTRGPAEALRGVSFSLQRGQTQIGRAHV